MLNSYQIITELQKLGFALDKDNARIKGLYLHDAALRLYIKTSSNRQPVTDAPLVIHPDFLDRRQDVEATGVKAGGMYHNSNMTGYPKRKHTGENPIGFGLDIDVPSLPSLHNLIRLLTGKQTADAYDDIQAAQNELEKLDATTRQQVIDARRGQGKFREELERLWDGQCCVTGVSNSSLLRASHIKPWRDSSNCERLDPNNGLLLIATLDAAFDSGLISFQDTGRIMLSPQLPQADALAAGIYNDLVLRSAPSATQSAYLQYHRNTIFRK